MNIRPVLAAAAIVFALAPASLAQTSDPLVEAFKASYAAEAQGKYDEAYQIMRSALGSSPSSYEGVMRLGYLKGMLGQYQEAAVLYGKAAEIEQGAVEPYVYQQYQYILLQDWAKLASSAGTALVLDPYNYTSRSRLAYAYYMQGKYAEAAEEYSKVSRLYPLDLDVMIMRGWSYALAGRKPIATRIFRKALTIAPDNTSAQEGMDYCNKLR